VFGLAHGCLGTALVTPAAMLAPMPCTLSFQEAATTPTVFITGEPGGQRMLCYASYLDYPYSKLCYASYLNYPDQWVRVDG